MSMERQFWIIKNAKKLQRKFNGKEDENIVASDNELDAKLELFKSINESTSALCSVLEKYKDGLHVLSIEQANLGTFLRDCGKNSASSEAVMCNSGKVICYLGTQHFSAMSSITRSLQELNTFKRAVNDTKDTIMAMEKERTEYRSALSLMKTCSADIDPDSGRGLEKFRTSQKYVKFAKQKFDKHSLACLQKIDLLAAARCNLFSYSLASYQTNWAAINEKNVEVLEAHIKIIEKEPKKHNFGILKDLAQEVEQASKVGKESEGEFEQVKLEASDKDQELFFGEEFCDSVGPSETEKKSSEKGATDDKKSSSEKLIDYEKDFDEFMGSANLLLPSQLLMEDSFFGSTATNADLLGTLVPTQTDANQTSDLLTANKENGAVQLNKNPSKNANEVSKWFSLFSELDPLNQQLEQDDANKNLHAA